MHPRTLKHNPVSQKVETPRESTGRYRNSKFGRFASNDQSPKRMNMKNIFLQIGNTLTSMILRSPVHGMLSRHTMLVAVTGHKSGRQITVPVNYFQEDSTLYITSSRGRMWWHNLRGSAPVTVHFRGKDIKGSGMLVDERGAVLQGLKRWFQKSPNAAQALGVRLDANGPICMICPSLHRTVY